MEFNRIRAVIPKPCAKCSQQELNWLREKHRLSEEAFWIYTIPVYTGCRRCETEPRGLDSRDSVFRKYAPMIASLCCPVVNSVQVPIPLRTVGLVERAIHAASVAEKGSEYRAHGTFIHHLSMLEEDEETKQALCVWAPAALGGYMSGQPGVTRRYTVAKPVKRAQTITEGGESQDKPTAAEPSAALKPPPGLASPASSSPKTVDCPSMIDHQDAAGNPDLQDGDMTGSLLAGNEYGVETRVKHSKHLTELYGPPSEKVMARQIGPDLIPTEVFQSALGNLKCGLAKRVQPLPYKPDKQLERKIHKTVTKLITEVFSRKKIIEWREQNPDLSEMASKKWSGARFKQAFNHLLSDSIEGRDIAHEFMIKQNEALPAKGKAPRPIITSGDEGQVAMLLPVKCFETLLFKHFKDASIKGVPKHQAMSRVANRLRFKERRLRPTVIEGDGSAWDACCNLNIRNITENRIIEHIIQVLGEDSEVPNGWLQQCLRDMKGEQLRGKAKLDEKKQRNPVRVVIDSIRQSGHRGTSAFNWLINYVCWMCVMCEYPEDMVAKTQQGELRARYKSSFDGRVYEIKYAFEGDDSALTTNEPITPERQKHIEDAWESLGFRMKLVFGSRKMTFTGFDFLCDELGPTQTFMPELARNIASSSWTTSAEAKSHKERLHAIGAAAMLARAENFADCGPFRRYFAALGLAHCKAGGDCSIGEETAVSLGIAPAESVEARLHEAADGAEPLTNEMRELVQFSCKLSHEQEANLLTCHFGRKWAPAAARHLIPIELWDPGNFQAARRR